MADGTKCTLLEWLTELNALYRMADRTKCTLLEWLTELNALYLNG